MSNRFIPVYLLVLFTLVTPVYVQGQNQTETQTEIQDGITNISMQLPLTPTLEVNATISDILRLLILEDVAVTDRILLISELESLLQNLTGNQFEINIELEEQEDGTEKVFTITVTSLNNTVVPVEETPVEETEEEPETEVVREESEGEEETETEEPEPVEPFEPVENERVVSPFG